MSLYLPNFEGCPKLKKKSYVTTKVNNAIPVGLGSIRPSEYVLKNRFKGFPHPYSLTFPENARKMISQ